jgi:hypothetical protein
VTEKPETDAPSDNLYIPKPRVDPSPTTPGGPNVAPVARLCQDFLKQWPVSTADGDPTAKAREVVDEISKLPVPEESLATMASYAVLMDAEIQAVLRDDGYDADSRVSQECDRQSRLGFEDDVVDACCALVESVRTGRVGSVDGRLLADANRFGYRALACLTSMCASLADELVRQSGEFGEYIDVVEWLRGAAAVAQSR